MAKKMKDQEGENSPDTGKGLADGSGGSVEDRPIVPPEMGAGAEVDVDQDDEVEAGGVPDKGVGDSLEAFFQEKGLKNPEDLVNFVKNLERKNTELGNENRTLRVTTMFPQPAMVQPRARTQRRALEVPEDPSEIFTDREKFTKYMGQALDVATTNARADIEEETDKQEYARLYQEAVVKANENPDEFARLQPKMLELSKTPAYAKANLDTLYERAKTEEVESRKRLVNELRQDLFGGDVDVNQLRAVLGKARTGQISTAGGAGAKLGAPATKEEMEEDIRKRILGAKLE